MGRFLDEEQVTSKGRFLDEPVEQPNQVSADKSKPWESGPSIFDPLSKATGISEAPSPFESAVSGVVNQAKNVFNQGLFGIPARINEEVFRPRGLSHAEELQGGLIGGEIIGGAIINTALKGVSKLYQIPAVKDSSIIKKSVEFFKKAVKPKSSHIKTSGALKMYDDKIADGLGIIAKNKANLTFGDDVGRMPKTVEEALDAAHQTRNKIFEEYTALRKAAGDSATINMSSVADELLESQSSLASSIATPGSVDYALKRAAELDKYGEIPLEVAEDVIRKYNATLDSFYGGKSAVLDDVSKLHIDAKTANIIRTKVDDVISSATGKDYQALKNAYGSVSEVEKNLVQQVAKMSKSIKQPVAGAVDTVPILYGALTGNKALLASGLLQKGIKAQLNILKDPNFLIRKSFSVFDDIGKSTTMQKIINTPAKGAATVIGRKALKKDKQ